jgi:hypothetical protein
MPRSSKTISNFFKRFHVSGRQVSRVRLVLLFCLTAYVVIILLLGGAWYSPQWITAFHFFNDAAEWKQMDKFAHFFWAFQISSIIARLLQWAGVNLSDSARGGAILGLLFVSSIEIMDGFSVDYGASIFDVGANLLGCAAFVGQSLLWTKVKIWPKFSFHHTTFAPLRPALLGDGFFEEILKDYNGQTFWYSFQVKRLHLPAWLTLAVGVGAEGMLRARDEQNQLLHFSAHRKYFLSLDLNFTHIQTRSRVLNSLIYFGNIIKIPAPAIEISSQGIRFHPIYF